MSLKLNYEKALEIRTKRASGVLVCCLAAEYSTSETTIYRVLKGVVWTKPLRSPVRARFWEKVDKSGSCWIWTGGLDRGGYGRFKADETSPKLAHRQSMEWHLGRVLEVGECVLHDCPGGDNPSCVNPSHLWIGTIADNNKDMVKKGRFNHHGGFPGESHGAAKLHNADVLRIRELSKEGAGYSCIAREFGLHHSTVRAIVLRRAWRHI